MFEARKRRFRQLRKSGIDAPWFNCWSRVFEPIHDVRRRSWPPKNGESADGTRRACRPRLGRVVACRRSCSVEPAAARAKVHDGAFPGPVVYPDQSGAARAQARARRASASWWVQARAVAREQGPRGPVRSASSGALAHRAGSRRLRWRRSEARKSGSGQVPGPSPFRRRRGRRHGVEPSLFIERKRAGVAGDRPRRSLKARAARAAIRRATGKRTPSDRRAAARAPRRPRLPSIEATTPRIAGVGP